MRQKNKSWAQPYLLEHPDIVLDPGRIAGCFDAKRRVYLEIGSGKGQFLVTMAMNAPDHFFIGVEKATTPCAIAAKKIVAAGLTNAMLVNEDIIKTLPEIPDASIEAIYLNFADPWPKKRHHKRRLTAPEFLKSYRRILVSDGTLRFKSDNEDLFLFTSQELMKSGYNIEQSSTNYETLDELDAVTEYEVAFRREGVAIYRLVARKG